MSEVNEFEGTVDECLLILLPSDKEWRMKNYYKLVEKQREIAASANPMPSHCPIRPESSGSLMAPSADRRREPSTLSLDTVQSSLTSNVHSETSWTVSDIAKAGQLLMQTSPAAVQFGSEEEMRRIYSLIYDAFRYRSVLNEALTDASFYGRFPDHSAHENIVVLLFYDLYKRRFLPRDGRNEAQKGVLFQEAGIPEVDADLWSNRVRLAAALARIRIKNNALKLSKLLPDHLKDDRVMSVDDSFATGWVNSFKSKESIPTLVESAGMKPVKNGQTYLETDNYQFDPICPKFILCHPEKRTSLISSPLVEDMSIVLQDRSFCLGPAILDRVLMQHQLTGPVVQTHITTPRSVAYLANILADNDKIEALLAFGAGDKKEEYEAYLTRLGVTNARVFSERFVDVPSESGVLDGVVGVLATPPNTYSGVTNPVDLVCSRGGDMEMLEVLTDVSGNTGCRERVKAILDEQRQTLRHSMSKPQTQVVVYVTHSVLPEENGKMVSNLVDEMNRTAWERHAEEQGARPPASTQSKSDVGDNSVGTKTSIDPRTASPKRTDSRDQHRTPSASSNVRVPLCDLFEVGEIPNICLNPDLKMEEEGCYLALLQRQEITRLDSMYMINIAEQRGLFGDHGSTPAKKARSHKAKRLDMEAARASARGGADASTRVCRPRRKVEIDRIAAPTMASLQRQVRDKGNSDDSSGSSVITTCARHEHHLHEFDGIKVSELRRQDVRRWWRETMRYLTTYRTFLDLDSIVGSTAAPTPVIVPPLRLTRSVFCGWLQSRLPFPVHISLLRFEDTDDDDVVCSMEDPDTTGCLKDFDRVVKKDEQNERSKNEGRGATLDGHGGKHRLSNESDKARREFKGAQRDTKVSLTFEEQADLVRRLSNPTQSSLSRLRTKLLRSGNTNEIQYQIPADIQAKYMERTNQTEFQVSVPPNTPLIGAMSESESQEVGESDDDFQPFD